MHCNLDIYTDYLISSTGQTSATGLSRLYGGQMSHDQITRFLTHAYFDSKDLWLQSKPLIRAWEAKRKEEDFAVLIVDDSIVEKAHTDENAMVCYHWDHSLGRSVKGVNFLSLLYQNEQTSLPIAVQLIEKTEPHIDKKTGKTSFKCKLTKNEYLRQMLQVAQNQVTYKYLLADNWYASAENMQAVLDLEHDFIFALESSRTVALSEQGRHKGQFFSLDSLGFPDKRVLKVYLRSLKVAVLVVKQVFTNKDGSQGFLYLVTSDIGLDYGQITTIYQRRWKVEEYHKSLKQNTSMGKSPTKTPNTQANHFFASILAYIKLEALKIKHSIGHFQLKAQLYLAGLKAMQNHLNLFPA
jgi:hypothetical protein